MTDTATASLQAIASEMILVEQTRALPPLVNAPFERGLSSPGINPFLGWNPGPHAVRSYMLTNAVLDGEFRGLIDSTGFIRGTGYLLPDDCLSKLRIDENHLVRVGGMPTVVVGCNLAYGNYFHWVTQALPAIDIALHRDGRTRPLKVALPRLNFWQQDSLDILGCDMQDRITIEDAGKQYAFENIEFSDVLIGSASFCRSDSTRRTYSRLRRAVGPATARPSKLYVARTDTETRRMRNEDGVIAELERRGFEIIAPGLLSFSEQARLFKGADLVIGVHGAGMTNIVFCEPGTFVYEIVPAHFANACFCNLAHTCALRYWADAFTDEGQGLPNLRDWQSDTGMVIRRVDEIETIMLALRDEPLRQPASAQYPPRDDREVLLTAAIGFSGTIQEIIGAYKDGRWIPGHSEGPIVPLSWRDFP
nr:glycosyltransferase family 61 protein [uncultured Rhodopila sp.]